MIDIKIKLNNVSSNINLQALAQDLASVIKQTTNQNCSTQINMQDDNSMSPLGIYKTQEYLKLRGRI